MASKVEIIDKTASLHCFLYESLKDLRKGGERPRVPGSHDLR